MASYLIHGNPLFCCGCRACEQRCPQNCITMEERGGFFYPVIDKDRCINCKLCERVCQYSEGNQEKLKSHQVINTYAAWSKEDENVIHSTSGGMFLTFAKKIIDEDGVVFGAKYTSDFSSVKMAYGQTVDECKAFRKSKYVFSDTKETYRQAEAFLKEGRQVMFSGTPCQISGLYSFLGKQYDNLVTIDLVCHGFNAPILMHSFTQMLEKKYASDIVSFDLRHKNKGESKPYLNVKFDKGIVYEEPYRSSSYAVMYGSRCVIMPSCTACQYSNTSRVGDLTIGDYWGIEEACPQASNVNGTSLVLVNSEKGRLLLDAIKNDMEIFETDLDTALKHNPPLSGSSPGNPFSRKVIRSLENNGFEKTYKDYKYFYSKLFLFYRLFRKIKNKFFAK